MPRVSVPSEAEEHKVITGGAAGTDFDVIRRAVNGHADREIRKLCSLGYHVKSALGIVQNKPDGYRIQPGAEVAHEPIAPPAPPRESDAR